MEDVMRTALSLLAVCVAVTFGMAQVTKATPPTPKEKIEQAKQLLKEAKKTLMNQGAYDCCIKEPWCDRCALDHQNCDCTTDVKQGKPVCPDCYAGWKRGDGTVPGVKADKVKMASHAHKH